MLKTIASVLVGIAAGVALAAWAETMDDDVSIDSLDLDIDDQDGDLNDDTTVTEEENDESLDDLATENAS